MIGPRVTRHFFVLTLEIAAICLLAKAATFDTLYRDRYSNAKYGYSLRIPNGLVGISDSPPSPQHGVRITLSDDPREIIWADGSYNALMWNTVEDAMNENLKWLQNDNDKVIELRRETIKLDSLPAIRTVVEYQDRSTQGQMIQELLLAIRAVKGETGIVYTVGLQTREAQYDLRKTILNSIISGWRQRPIAK